MSIITAVKNGGGLSLTKLSRKERLIDRHHERASSFGAQRVEREGYS